MSKVRKKRPSIHKGGRHRTWQLQEAKARFSELVTEVMEDGYQTITKNGHPVAVIISHKEFERFKKPKNNLGDFLLDSPIIKYELNIERVKDLGRDIDLYRE